MLTLPHMRAPPRAAARSFAAGELPRRIDPSQVPARRQPFAALRAQRWAGALDVITPAGALAGAADRLAALELRWAKVILKLGDVLDGDLFTEAVKRGNVIMMSEGRRGVDNRFELCEGILRLELDKATYERAGLLGKPMQDGGLKHKVNRYAIEIDLRQPSMLHGKKGFERIVWACRNVLTQSLTWLFCNLAANGVSDASKALEKHHPRWMTSRCTSTVINATRVPDFQTFSSSSDDFSTDDAADLEEWLSLVALKSPRILTSDSPNPFICRYSLPTCHPSGRADAKLAVDDLAILRWHGFLPSQFLLEILQVLHKNMDRETWWALKSRGLRHAHDTVVLLRLQSPEEDGQRHFCWHSAN